MVTGTFFDLEARTTNRYVFLSWTFPGSADVIFSSVHRQVNLLSRDGVSLKKSKVFRSEFLTLRSLSRRTVQHQAFDAARSVDDHLEPGRERVIAMHGRAGAGRSGSQQYDMSHGQNSLYSP